MADYHPLDTRYKGPSTAYRGSARPKPADRPLSQPATSATPDGPWGKGPPPLPDPDRYPSPPPLPETLPHAAPAAPRRPGAGRRVLLIFAILIAFVVVNQLLGRMTGMMAIELDAPLNTVAPEGQTL